MKVQQYIAVSIALICTLFISSSVTAGTFDQAVNEYLKGYKACTDANTLRTKNLQQAQAKFNLYLQHLKKAKAIDPSILQSSKRDMDSNLRYCERVEINIKRAEAAPILEKGFTYCDSSKEALKTGDINSAQSSLEEYKQYRDDALKVTESIMEVFALASKVRSCGRLEGKVSKAIQKDAELTESLKLAISNYQSITKKCRTARSTIKSKNFKQEKLGSVNQIMNEVSRAKKNAWKNQTAFNLLAEQPNRAESQQLQKLVDQAAACEGETSELIRVATNRKRDSEKFILGGVSTLQASQKACESAQLISSRSSNIAELSKAESKYKESAALKHNVVKNSKLISAVKNNPAGSASQQFSRLMKSTGLCQNTTAKSIKAQKASLSQKQNQKQEAALQAKRKQEAERKAKDKEARRKAEERKKAALAEQEKKKKDPLFDSEGYDDPDFDDFDDDKKRNSSGKSWTDLVR